MTAFIPLPPFLLHPLPTRPSLHRPHRSTRLIHCPRLPRTRISRPHLVLTRGIVIFADYLSDLIVLDILHDIIHLPSSPVPLLLALLAALSALPAADLLSALAAWLHHTYLPAGLFDFLPVRPSPVFRLPAPPPPFPLPAPAPARVLVAPTSGGVRPALLARPRLAVPPSPSREPLCSPAPSHPPRRDVFQQLVNSCALVTTPLTVLAGWTPSSATPQDVFLETFLVATLSLLALSPLLRQDGPDGAVLAALRRVRVFKPKGAPGWCQINGMWDRPLADAGVLLWAENVVEKAGVKRRRGRYTANWWTDEHDPT